MHLKDGFPAPGYAAVFYPDMVPTVTQLESPPAVPLGTGIYSWREASRLLALRPDRLRRWVSGYTYWLRDAQAGSDRRRKRQAGVIQAGLPVIRNVSALSFHELMELRVVKALVDRGVSLQHVRRAAAVASTRFETRHPFASRRVFTDGRHVFSAVSDHDAAPDVVKWTPAEIDQVIAGPVFDQFLSEIEFDTATSLARRWWPLGRSMPVLLDPSIGFGAPIVMGTGIRTSALAAMARASSARDTAVAYEIEVAMVEAAVAFENVLAA